MSWKYEISHNEMTLNNIKYVCIVLFTRRIPGDLQQVVFNVAAQSNEDWSNLLNMFVNVTYDAEKRKMLRGLASTQDPMRIVW